MSILRDAGFFLTGAAFTWVAKPHMVKAYHKTKAWSSNRKAKKVVAKEASENATEEGAVKEDTVVNLSKLGKAVKTFFIKATKTDKGEMVEVTLADGEVVKISASDLARTVDAEIAEAEAVEDTDPSLTVLKS